MERWIDNHGIRLQTLESGTPGSGMPVLFLPGPPGGANGWLPDMEALAPRHTLAVSLRGAVPSEAPELGYAVEDFASDAAAVMDQCEVKQAVLVGFSVASLYVLTYALANPERVAALVLIDFPPTQSPLPPEWADRVMASAPPEFFRPVVVRGLQRDARNIDLWDRLPEVRCPVLVMKGAQQGSRLSEADLQRYRDLLPNVEVAIFADSGHNVRQPDQTQFQNVLRSFVEKLDA